MVFDLAPLRPLLAGKLAERHSLARLDNVLQYATEGKGQALLKNRVAIRRQLIEHHELRQADLQAKLENAQSRLVALIGGDSVQANELSTDLNPLRLPKVPPLSPEQA